jgi:hypothetical protein
MKKAGADAVVTAELALKRALPSATVPRSFAEIGGLMSYGAAISGKHSL